MTPLLFLRAQRQQGRQQQQRRVTTNRKMMMPIIIPTNFPTLKIISVKRNKRGMIKKGGVKKEKK